MANVKGCSPQSALISSNAFDKAKHSGVHDAIQSPPKSFASELMGLLSCSIVNSSKHQSRKKDSYLRILPDHIRSAIQKWALVTQEKVALPLEYNPNTSLLEQRLLRQDLRSYPQRLVVQFFKFLFMPSYL
eukprot:1150553-Pelagomonas_calceolata.AAC.13